ncbi:MAG: bifunctional hydroxymethylpyrimidine kinase/phosphomethylpyrimidine kinase [candidate division Zixibacteria bacterium]|nr:bifunctional hydroxymethylpyrimidine kinase/phosphomethylpyrimidine kinase [candidate division Zixibacteria bacterium]
MKRALTIAGSDCSGGAGIQADLKTFSAFQVFGMSAITAIVAENTVGVQAVFDIPVNIVVEQIKSCLDDIGSDAVKVGMLSNPEITIAVANCINEYKLNNLVVDPVMVAKSGDPLLSEEARSTIKEYLLPLADVITPNRFEAETLTGKKIDNIDSAKKAARELKEIGCKFVVVKGGHLDNPREAVDIVFDGEQFYEFSSQLIPTKNTHGTGCTFSSAIAAGLAKGYAPLEAIKRAKGFITEAIAHSADLGQGHGPTNHFVGTTSSW